LILGNSCTRNCAFCAVDKSIPLPLDPEEPVRMAEAARRLKLEYVFITSVTRDDLPDGGAAHFARTTQFLYQEITGIKVELLIPDFQGDATAIKTVVEVNPTVLGHNLETVLRLYPRVRPMANYQRSLDVLRIAKEYDSQLLTKSGLMLGLGETREEVIAVMRDLRQVDCDMLTLGQYLSPSSTNYPVVSFVTPQEFAEYIPIGLEMGFKGVASAPLMRSSFKADEQYKAVKISRGG
jgi:lipoic acid synthetase